MRSIFLTISTIFSVVILFFLVKFCIVFEYSIPEIIILLLCLISFLSCYVLLLFLAKKCRVRKYLQVHVPIFIMSIISNVSLVIMPLFLFTFLDGGGRGTSGFLVLLFLVPFLLVWIGWTLASWIWLSARSRVISDAEYTKQYGAYPMFSVMDMLFIISLIGVCGYIYFM